MYLKKGNTINGNRIIYEYRILKKSAKSISKHCRYFAKFIYHLQPETKTLIRKIERILDKLYRQNLSLLFNETCLNE